MKKKFTAFAACAALVLLVSSSALASLNLTPAGALASGPQTEQPDINTVIDGLFPGPPALSTSEVYKADAGTPVVESGPAAGFYTTVFTPTSDPSGATITWDGGLSIIDATHLLVKGGATPSGIAAWYLFDISHWTGTSTITLSEFWPIQGSILHVSIYGDVVAVPEPASVGLFMLGMSCVASGALIRRRRA